MKAMSNGKKRPAVFQVDDTVSLEEQIARRARDLWHQRGCGHGGDMDDWLQAEREINEWHHKRMQGKNSPLLDRTSA